jgi:hypothetical protein
MMINKYKLIEGIKKIKSIRYQMFIILILTKKDWKNLGMKAKRRLEDYFNYGKCKNSIIIKYFFFRFQ